MIRRGDGSTEASKRGIGAVWIVLCVIFGAGVAFLAAAFDGVMAFGSSFTRFKVVFLVSWPVATGICYVAVRDLQEKWSFLTDRSRVATLIVTGIFVAALVVATAFGRGGGDGAACIEWQAELEALRLREYPEPDLGAPQAEHRAYEQAQAQREADLAALVAQRPEDCAVP